MAKDWTYDPARREHEIEECWAYMRDRILGRIKTDCDLWIHEINAAEEVLKTLGMKDSAMLLTAASMKMGHLALLEGDE